MQPGNTCSGPLSIGATGCGNMIIVATGLLQYAELDAVIVYVPAVANEQLKLLPDVLQLAAGDTIQLVVPVAVDVNVTG